MVDPKTVPLEIRCNTLESQIKTLRRIFALVVLGLIVVSSLGANFLGNAQHQIAATGGFALLDRNGATRAYLGFEKDGSPSLSFYDEAGEKARIVVGISKSGPTGFCLRDTHGKDRVILGEYRKDTASLYLADTNNVPRLQMNVYPKGSAFIQMHDSDNKLRMLSGLSDGGDGTLRFSGSDGQKHVEIALDRNNSPSLEMSDIGGVSLLKIPRLDAGVPKR